MGLKIKDRIGLTKIPRQRGLHPQFLETPFKAATVDTVWVQAHLLRRGSGGFLSDSWRMKVRRCYGHRLRAILCGLNDLEQLENASEYVPNTLVTPELVESFLRAKAKKEKATV